MTSKYHIAEKSRGIKLRINIHDSIDDFADYDELFDRLLEVGPDDEIELRLNCPGGRCDVGFRLIDALRETKRPVVSIVEYPTYSMGAILALAGDGLIIKPGAYLMFHDYSTEMYGKGNELDSESGHYSRFFSTRMREICMPFLTKKECDAVLSGHDMYVREDSNLEVRKRRHFKHRGGG